MQQPVGIFGGPLKVLGRLRPVGRECAVLHLEGEIVNGGDPPRDLRRSGSPGR
jgi:hypothetical protein